MSLKLKSKDEIMEEIIRLHNLILSTRESWSREDGNRGMKKHLESIENKIQTLSWVLGCDSSKPSEVNEEEKK